MKALALAVALLGAAVSGCTSVRTDTTETGLFENDPDKLVSAFEYLEEKTSNGERLTLEDLECLGFNLKAPNIEDMPGPTALKRIFGDTVFLDEKGAARADVNLSEFAQYRGYTIPYRRIETTTDRFYMSEYEQLQKGVQLQILLLLKKEKLCYCELRAVRLDTYYSHNAPLEGLIALIRSPGKAALKLLVKVEEYQNPGLKVFIPIPID